MVLWIQPLEVDFSASGMSDTSAKQKKISTAKAAAFLGVSRWTLRRWGDRKVLPFITSKSGYRYYRQEDLIALKDHHVVVRVPHAPVKSHVAHSPRREEHVRDETLLLPSPPVPEERKEAPINDPYVPAMPVLPEAKPDELVIPPPPTPPQERKSSVFSKLLKILPFTGASVFFLFLAGSALLRVVESDRIPQPIVAVPGEKTPVLSRLSFRDVVLAAATDSGDVEASSVAFFLTGEGESARSLLSPDTATPSSGNNVYMADLTTFSRFQDSPFAYLNGSHGAAGPVAIIEHADSLRSHPFFSNVQNGDKLLIYRESAKAILFRPFTNEVIAFAPLDAVPEESYEQPAGQPVVALRNGMGTPYDMKTFEAELTFVAPESVAVDNAEAENGNYKTSILIDVLGNKAAQAQQLASRLKLKVAPLPEGEYRPPAGVDFLVILGRDRVPFMNYIAPSSTASATKTP